ncbi:TPA: glutamate-5-semialdehyde dehydrogenase [Candidatus Peregrinibacteria bacterium]|nr:glutamate-5-semialdehyde dehydrogenase [Candidatus Peregrinibacteria bacterium]
MRDFTEIFDNAKTASLQVARLSTQEKNTILLKLSEKLIQNTENILEENAKDIINFTNNNFENLDMIDRLLLKEERILGIANEIKNVAKLHDFVGEKISEQKMESGLTIKKMRVPLGVIAMIYESRPNVTIDAGVLAFKSGNAIILKGGKEAEFSNQILAKLFREVLAESGIKNAVQLIENASREDTAELLKAKGKIDLLIPRGGKGLIKFVSENSLVPVIETGASVVHTFIDESADFEMAKNIIINEKTRRVSVCNALDTVLIHVNIAEKFLEYIVPELEKVNVVIKRPSELSEITVETLDELFSTEYLSSAITLHIVDNIEEALEHIKTYSLGHSESIVTENQKNADIFLAEVDAACVYHNASTAFSDGAQFGLGAEIGISTQKLHARGPFALEALTSIKWVITGNGAVRV